MKRSRPSRPRVKLNRDAVWELLDQLGMPWNEPARRWYGNAADLHHPRPGDSQIRDITQKNTVKEQEHTAAEMLACSGDPPLCRGVKACACGAQRLVDQKEKPAGIWSGMRPVPYANPIG